MSVALINPFEVPEGKEEEALAFWERVAEYMRKQPGFGRRAFAREMRLIEVGEIGYQGQRTVRVGGKPDFFASVSFHLEASPRSASWWSDSNNY